MLSCSRTLLFLAALSSAGWSQEGTSRSVESRVSFLLGGRSMEDGRLWDSFDDQVAFGVEYARGWVHEWGTLGFEVGANAAYRSNLSDTDGEILDVRGGLRFARRYPYLRSKSLHVYVGTGVALVHADLDGFGFDDDDTAGGLYAHGGVRLDVGRGISLGVDASLVRGTDIEFNGVEGDADSTQIAFVASWNPWE